MRDEVYKQVINEVKAAGGVVPEDQIQDAITKTLSGSPGSMNNSLKKISG